MSPYRFLHLLWLIPAWMIQYTMVVPLIWLWRALVVPAAKIGIIGLALLCIPIIGWIILAVMILRRPREHRPHTYARPWGASLVAGGAR